MPRLFLTEECRTGLLVTVRADKARYLSRVLRSRRGDRIIVVDKSGGAFESEVVTASTKEVTIRILGQMRAPSESPLRITHLQGVLKGDKMDLVVEKAVELGVHCLIPVVTGRSQVRVTRKVPRWNKIAEEAARQSGRRTIPHIYEPVDIIKVFDLLEGEDDGRIIFWEERGTPLGDVLKAFGPASHLHLFTGPEGGFSEDEIMLARENRFVAATLGTRILRAETAAIAVLSIIQYSLGDLGHPLHGTG